MKIKIGANIKAIRKSRGMTQEQLAEKLGVVYVNAKKCLRSQKKSLVF